MNNLLAEVNIGDIPINNSQTKISETYSTAAPLINVIIRNSIAVASILFLALLIFGGIAFIAGSGSGDQKQAGKGQKAITSAAIGFIIIIFAYLIIRVVETITGLPILSSGL